MYCGEEQGNGASAGYNKRKRKKASETSVDTGDPTNAFTRKVDMAGKSGSTLDGSLPILVSAYDWFSFEAIAGDCKNIGIEIMIHSRNACHYKPVAYNCRRAWMMKHYCKCYFVSAILAIQA